MAKQQKDHVLDGEVLPPLEREVGVKLAGKVYVPAMPADARAVQAHNDYMQWHNHAVSLLDQYHAIREQYAANRKLIWRPSAEAAAQEEEEAELKHQRKLAKLRREREVHEHALAALEAKHTLEAAEEFKSMKFASGAARFAAKTAQHRVGEAVANASMGGRPAQAAGAQSEKVARPPIVDVIVQGIDDLEKQIEEREASGFPAEALHGQRDALRGFLMRELKKAG
jgi:hypothetical protein